jgi:hypothetical protein
LTCPAVQGYASKYVRLVFGYELVPTEAQRLARQDRLIRELVPACNQWQG